MNFIRDSKSYLKNLTYNNFNMISIQFTNKLQNS